MTLNGFRPRFIVFDLDGTLIDSRQDIADSANAMLASYAQAPLADEIVIRMVGEGARTLVARILQTSGVAADVDEALARFVTCYDRRLLHHTRPYPGVAAGLEQLATRGRLAVLTNKPQVSTDRLLAHFGWSRLLVGAVGGDTALGRKPDPTGFHALARRAGVEPAETLMVGDSWVDVDTARRAGARVCFARYGFGEAPAEGLRDDEPHVESFDELVTLLT